MTFANGREPAPDTGEFIQDMPVARAERTQPEQTPEDKAAKQEKARRVYAGLGMRPPVPVDELPPDERVKDWRPNFREEQP